MAGHEPVLMREVLEGLAIAPTDTVVDATLGGAGHFSAILARLGEGGTLIGIDADSEAVARAHAAYGADRRLERPTAHLVHDNFRNLAQVLARLGIARIDAALFDLGWSGYQLSSLRGFSFANAYEPLLMTYGQGVEGETAASIINSAGEGELARILAEYGEERFARAIARAIVERRASARILTVGELVAVIEAAVPAWYRKGRVHPATRSFQALRIATNDEFGAIKEGIGAALVALTEGGRLAVITFHSLEDRVVKQLFKEAEGEGRGSASKKPLSATRAEVLQNRRARSAKLRVFTTSGGRSRQALLSYV